jgi:HPt (histidine-containing phosphotransfer) domain-containing protein
MNLKALAEKVDLDETEYLDMIDLFLETSSANLVKLETGVETGDTRKVIESAHSIKGSAVSLGLTEIYEVASRVEADAHANNLKGTYKAVETIKAELNRIAEQLSPPSTMRN